MAVTAVESTAGQNAEKSLGRLGTDFKEINK
jgi:hypothetical protein